jgi:Tfp pilus assembly protein PilN
MIRINLLPREERSQREVKIDIKVGDMVVPMVVLAIVAVTLGGTVFLQRAQVGKLTADIATVEEEARALAPQIARVNRLAAERAELDLRLGIISRLEPGRTKSVRLMDELAQSVPDHLWLMSATQDGDNLALEGMTFSNLVVSEFMSRLERSPWFAGVELEVAERQPAGDGDAVRFRLSCRITPEEQAN